MTKRNDNNDSREDGRKQNKVPLTRRIFRRVSKIILWLLAIYVTVSISLIILFQFQCFRNSALSAILLIVNSGLEAKIEIDDLYFMNLNGLSLSGVRLIADSDTLVAARRIVIDMDFFQLPDSKAIVNKIVLEKPVIKLLRNSNDSTWNYTHIAAPSENVDDNAKPADWLISINDLEIVDGTFFMIDSVNNSFDSVVSNNDGIVSFGRLGLRNLNLNISAEIRPAENQYSAEISSLTFKEIFSGFGLDNLTADVLLSPKKIELSNGQINTGESNFAVDASIKNFNIFGTPEEQAIENAFFDIDLSGDAVSIADVKHFAEIPAGQAKPLRVDIEAVGILNELTIDKLALNNEGIDLELKGDLKNLLDPDNFGYDLEINKSRTSYSWLVKVLSGIDLSGVPNFGPARIRHLHAIGDTKKVKASINITSAIGAANGPASIDWSNRRLVYSGNLRCNNVDLSSITGNGELKSNLNGKVAFKGSGVDITKMNAGVRVRLAGSSFQHNKFSKLNFDANVSYGGLIKIDTLLIVQSPDVMSDNLMSDNSMPDTISDELIPDAEISEMFLEGYISVNDTNPAYSIKSGIRGMNFAEIFNNDIFPNKFSADFELSGSGFDPDSLTAVFKSSIEEYQLGDRSMFPFYVDASISNTSISNTSNSGRVAALKSDFIDLNISGSFTFANLIANITHSSQFIADFIQDRIESFKYEKAATVAGSLPEDNPPATGIGDTTSIGDIDCRITAHIKDLTVISTFVEDLNINSSSTIDIQLNRADNKSSIKLNKFHINELLIEQPGFNLTTDTLHLRGLISMEDSNSATTFSGLRLDLDKSGDVSLNGLIISSPKTSLTFDGRLLSFGASATINNSFGITTKGEVAFEGSDMYVGLDNLDLNYAGRFVWRSLEPVKIVFNNDGIDIRKFHIGRDSSESLSLGGKYINDSFQNASLFLHDFKVSDFISLVPEANRKILSTLHGEIDSLNLNLDGTPARPAIEMKLQGRDFSFNNTFIGGITMDLHHLDSNLAGDIVIDNPQLKAENEIIKIKIDSLPLNLGMTDVENRFHSNSIVKVTAKAHDIPLKLGNGFIPGITDIKGTGKFNLLVKGTYPDRIFYRGKASFNYANFLLESTNLKYIANGDIDILRDGITINNITVKNRSDDLYGGKANVSGKIKLKGFNLDYIDLTVKTQKLKVLGLASKKPLPNIFGNLIIATGKRPLRFFGTLDKPNLAGDVVIKKADLIMPQTIQGVKTKSKLIYEIKQTGSSTSEPLDLTPDQNTKKQPASDVHKKRSKGNDSDFADLMNYDLYIQFLSNLVVQMDINALTSLKSEISTADRSKPLHFIKKRDRSKVEIFGKMVLQSNSRLTLLKMWSFVTTGSIDFPTGSIDNPVLDLKASYRGRSNVDNKLREYEVIIGITGPKKSPKITFDYIINDQKATGEQSELQKNAMTLLLTGQTSDELLGSKGSGQSSVMNEAANEFLQSQLSNSLTQALRGTGFINKAEVELTEGGIEEANVKLYGNLAFLGDVEWSFGSNVADVGDSEFSVTLPLSTIFQPEIFNNFIVQFSKFANSEQVYKIDRKDWEIKIKLGRY